LIIDPVIPENWQEFKVFRKFRGVKYDIQISRIGRGDDMKIELDSETVEGNIITDIPEVKTEVDANVSIGSEN